MLYTPVKALSALKNAPGGGGGGEYEQTEAKLSIPVKAGSDLSSSDIIR